MGMDNPYNRIPMARGTWAVICLGGEPGLSGQSGLTYAASLNIMWRPMVAFLELP